LGEATTVATPIRDYARRELPIAPNIELTNSRAERLSCTDRAVVGWSTPGRRGDAQGGTRLSLWWAPLDVSATVLAGLAACASSEERRRAGRFTRPRDCRRFLAARGWLRHVLASELSCAPHHVPIVTDNRGKPRIAHSDLSFSASRTADVALYALSWSTELGVDIEVVRETAEARGIVARFMSPAERHALDSLPRAQRLVAFFDCWTRKEAYGKAIGTGLGSSMRELDLWAGDSAPVTVHGWTVHQIDLAPGFAGAVAGADTSDWVPPIPRRIHAASRDCSYRPPPGRVRGVLAASRG
jgi:4'-phosphopantetheinyl transferase